jgi:excisionase family DNA binding protein
VQDEPTVTETAEYLGVSPLTVHSWIRKGLLVPTRALGRGRGNGYRFRREDVERFVPPARGRARRERAPTPADLALVEEIRARYGLPADATPSQVVLTAAIDTLRDLRRRHNAAMGWSPRPEMTPSGMVPGGTV